jgi:hypothetical protein
VITNAVQQGLAEGTADADADAAGEAEAATAPAHMIDEKAKARAGKVD